MTPDIADTVRDTLDERARTLEVHTPTWGELEGGLRRVRRSRRRQRAMRAGSLLAAAALAVGGVQTGLLPYPRHSAAPAAPSPSALDTGHVRGNLASDAAFLAALRGVVARRTLTQWNVTWRVPSPADVHVLYASNAPGHRVALVEVRLRAGQRETRQQIWFVGPAGAAPDQLEEVSSDSPKDQAVIWLEYRPANGLGGLVVVSARRATYLLAAEAPVYAAGGTVRRQVDRSDVGPDGVLERQVPTTPGVAVLGSFDTNPRKWTVLGSGHGETFDSAVPRNTVEGRAVPSGGREQLIDAFAQLATSSGLTRSPRSVLWTGALGDWSAAAVAVTAQSGARLVRVQVRVPEPGQPGAWLVRSVSTVLPSGRLRDVALAWQLPDPSDTGDRPPVRHVGVLGPVGAASARLVDGTTQLAEAALTDRAGLLPPPGQGHEQARVEFTDAAGRVLERVGVLDLHAQLPTGLPR